MTSVLLLVGLGWIYVVLMMAMAEAMSPVGSMLGACFTFVLYGVLPLGIVLYLLATPARRRRRKALEAAEASAAHSAAQPDGSGHAAGDAVAPEGEEPRR